MLTLLWDKDGSSRNTVLAVSVTPIRNCSMREHEKFAGVQKIKMTSLVKNFIRVWVSYQKPGISGNLVLKLFSELVLHTFHKGLKKWSRLRFWFSAMFVFLTAKWNAGMWHLLSYAHFLFNIYHFQCDRSYLQKQSTALLWVQFVKQIRARDFSPGHHPEYYPSVLNSSASHVTFIDLSILWLIHF